MENEWKKRIQMPIGVYVCITLVLIKFGILNFIGYFLTFRNAEGEASLPVIVISLALCVFTAGAAIWAYMGQNEGRVTLLIMIPLNILWVILFAISVLLNDDKIDDEWAVFTIIQQVFLSLFVIGIEWYLMSSKVVEYYKQDG